MRTRTWTKRGWGLVGAGGLLLGCASAPERMDSPAVERARQLMRQERAHTGSLVLNCEPGDAEVSLDGVAQGFCTDFGEAQGGLSVSEGPHRIEVTKDGYGPYTTYYEPGRARAVLTLRLRRTGAE